MSPIHTLPSLKIRLYTTVYILGRWRYLAHAVSLTHSMVQSPSWEVNRFSPSQEIPRMELEHPSPPLQVPATCSYPEPDQSIPWPAPSHILKILLDITHPTTSGSSKWPFHCLVCTKGSVEAQSTCILVVTRPVFTERSCQHIAQPPSWRTNPCRLSVTAYLIYSQLPSILEALPPSTTWRRAICYGSIPVSWLKTDSSINPYATNVTYIYIWSS